MTVAPVLGCSISLLSATHVVFGDLAWATLLVPQASTTAGTVFQTLTSFFARHGYWVVFFGVMLEDAGLPIPGETVLLFAGFLAHHGELELSKVILTAILGATLGDTGGYCLGRFGGNALVEKGRNHLPFFAHRFDQAQKLFLRHGRWAVFIGRFITGLRVFAGLLAGLFRMRYTEFLFYNFAGAVGWATAVGCVGFVFGENWQRIVHLVKAYNLITLAVILVAALVVIAIYWKKRRSAR